MSEQKLTEEQVRQNTKNKEKIRPLQSVGLLIMIVSMNGVLNT